MYDRIFGPKKKGLRIVYEFQLIPK